MWLRACEHEPLCWACACSAFARSSQPRCPLCRAAVCVLRRGFDATTRRDIERINVSELQRRHAAELCSSGAAAMQQRAEQAEAEAAAASHQEAADAEAAAELQAQEQVDEQVEEAAALAEVAEFEEEGLRRRRAEQEFASFARRISEELGRGDWRVWLLACAYAGLLPPGIGADEARVFAMARRREGQPVLLWAGGVHGRFLYDLGAQRGRGARRAPPDAAERLLQLLSDCGLRETVLRGARTHPAHGPGARAPALAATATAADQSVGL